MKKLFSLVLMVLMLLSVLPIALGEQTPEQAIDVTGFWYSEDDGSGIELQDDGTVLVSNEDGETVAEGTFTADGPNVTMNVGEILKSVVEENVMTMEDGKVYVRDGIEVGYWNNDSDNTALELYDGAVWSYNEAGDVLAEGIYTIDGNTVTIILGDKTLTGVINDSEMIIDDVVYSLL